MTRKRNESVKTTVPLPIKAKSALDVIDECLVQLDDAIVGLTKISNRVALIVGFDHDAYKACELANEKSRVARAKLEIVRQRVK